MLNKNPERNAQSIADDMRDAIDTLTALMNEGKSRGVVLNFNINEADVEGKKTFVATTIIQKIENL